MKKRLVTLEEVRDVYFAGKRRICVPDGAIITPGARDLMYAFNMELAHETAPAQGALGTDPPGERSDTVKGVVESVMVGRSAEDKKRVFEEVMTQLAVRSS